MVAVNSCSIQPVSVVVTLRPCIYAMVMPWPGDLPCLFLFSSRWLWFLMSQFNHTSTEECSHILFQCDLTSCPLVCKDPGIASWRLQVAFTSQCMLQGHILAWSFICTFRGALRWLQAVKDARAYQQAPALCHIWRQKLGFSSWVYLNCQWEEQLLVLLRAGNSRHWMLEVLYQSPLRCLMEW